MEEWAWKRLAVKSEADLASACDRMRDVHRAIKHHSIPGRPKNGAPVLSAYFDLCKKADRFNYDANRMSAEHQEWMARWAMHSWPDDSQHAAEKLRVFADSLDQLTDDYEEVVGVPFFGGCPSVRSFFCSGFSFDCFNACCGSQGAAVGRAEAEGGGG